MRILLCTDASPKGQAALKFGALLASKTSEPATLLGVVEHSGEQNRIEQALAEGRQWLAGAPEPRIRVREGHAAEEILAEATPEHYDLVVVGARGRRGITRFLMGSTAERIARHARLPTLIVRGEHQKIERILVCTGGKAPGLRVVAFGGRVASLVGAEVTVLHVMSQLSATAMLPEAGALRVMPQAPAPPDSAHFQLVDLDASAEELMARETTEGVHLQQALTILAELDVPARAVVRHGLVVDEVEGEARQGDYNLVTIGAHTATGWMRLLLKDVEGQIMGCFIDRPVLVVRGPGEDIGLTDDAG
jgi:nucleotide-binding universal stress UspA family protein